MKALSIAFLLLIGLVSQSFGQTEQQLIDLSKKKWQWMADKNVDELKNLFVTEVFKKGKKDWNQ